VASFDRAISPGGEGKITLSVRTKGYEGAHSWGAKVNTNDPKWNVVVLEAKAFVNVPIFISPRWVYLQGHADEIVTKWMNIRAGLDKPLTLIPRQFSLEGKLRYWVEEVEKGRRFRIRFSSIPGPPGNYNGLFKLETNYPEMPFIDIRIRGAFAEKKNPSK